MLPLFNDFREKLSEAMLPAIHKRVLLYGYGYTGRFLKWYANYYHSINIDFVISLDMSTGHSYEEEIYRPSLLEFNYKDSMDTVMWLAVPLDEKLKKQLESFGFSSGYNIVDFYKLIYGTDISWGEPNNDCDEMVKPSWQRKAGIKDIQFLEWLEWKYECNFVTAVKVENLSSNGASYKVTTQKEIFPIMDKCHIGGDISEGIFDFGCGKGGALVAFRDYGFNRIGGVEFDPGLYDVLIDNMNKLGMYQVSDLELIKGDATKVTEQLDKYSWFYFFDPFGNEVFARCLHNIRESIRRRERKVHIIFINPHCYEVMRAQQDFKLVNQFIVSMRQKVVSVWENVR